MNGKAIAYRFFIPMMLSVIVWFYYSPRLDLVQCAIALGCFGMWGLVYNGYARLRKREMSPIWWGIGYGIVVGVVFRLIWLMYLVDKHL